MVRFEFGFIKAITRNEAIEECVLEDIEEKNDNFSCRSPLKSVAHWPQHNHTQLGGVYQDALEESTH